MTQNIIEYDLSTLQLWSKEKIIMCSGYLEGKMMEAKLKDDRKLFTVFRSLKVIIDQEALDRGFKVPEIEKVDRIVICPMCDGMIKKIDGLLRCTRCEWTA